MSQTKYAVKFTTQFRKDYKLAIKRGLKIELLEHIVALLAAALGPVLIIIGKTLSAIGTIMTWAPKLAGAISAVKGAFATLSATMMANPIAIVIAANAALVAVFIYLWNTNEEFR